MLAGLFAEDIVPVLPLETTKKSSPVDKPCLYILFRTYQFLGTGQSIKYSFQVIFLPTSYILNQIKVYRNIWLTILI